MGCTLAAWEGPAELLLAKVKNASGRIGIFLELESSITDQSQMIVSTSKYNKYAMRNISGISMF